MWATTAISAMFVAATWLGNMAEAGWPLCKQQCDSNFSREQLLEHPGVASVCHRGCELFTVALIAAPHGGLPLLEKKVSVSHGVVNSDFGSKLANLLRGSSVAIAAKDNSVNFSKLEKLDKVVVHQKEDDGKPNERLRAIMEKMGKGKEKIQERMMANKKMKPDDLKQVPKAGNSGNVSCGNETLKHEKKVPKVESTEENPKSHQQHIHFIKPFSPPYSTALKSGTVRIPIKIFEGAPAKQILTEARAAEEVVVVESPKAHGPVHTSTLANKSLVEVSNLKGKTESKGMKSKTEKVVSKKTPHGPVSKTTVQPASHPVQDHPVHASRQITTDSSGAEERKTTTPQSSNISLPSGLKPPDLVVFAELANKLGSSVKSEIHPLIRLSFDEPKSIGIFPAPQRISIIEIIKNKNNIDFEKLHQDHMKDAIHCPIILERFEEAKDSCRHACTKAYPAHKEYEACVVGCQLQASSSSAQVRSQLLQPPVSGPDGLFSSVQQFFANLASHFGFAAAPELPIPRGFGTPDHRSLELKQPAHVGMEMYFEKSGPRTVQKKTIIGPRGRIVDTETIVQVSDHGSLLTPGQILQQQLENHKKLVHQEMEMQGKLLAEDPFNIEMELNRQLEVLGKHLTEDARNVAGEPSVFPPFFGQLLLQKVGSRDDKDHQPSENERVADEEKKGDSLFENLFPFPSSLTGILRTDKKENKDADIDDLLFRHNSLQKETQKTPDDKDVEKHDEKSDLQIQINDVEESAPTLQLDLLDCISRKSGLPHWLIVFSIYTSVLVVFWLCFLLYAYIVELRGAKSKMPTLVYDVGEPLMDDCCETKKLLPSEECIEIRVKTV